MQDEHKSERIKQVALSNGWKAEVVPKLHVFEQTSDPSDIEWHVYAIREKETLHVIYRGNRYISGAYSYGSYRQSPARSGAVIRLLTGKPNPRWLDALAVRVPWEPDAPALDIMKAVYGRSITWIRKIDQEICEARIDKEVNRGNKYFRLSESKAGRRILEWQDREGFHAVGLDQIIDVN